MSTIAYSGTLVTRTCWCGTRHAIPTELSKSADEQADTSVYCPLGHKWVSSVHAKREAELERERAERAERRERATRELLRQEERSHSATRGHLTRTKKRVAAGVCPCCNRTFQQLSRHMKSQHPDYSEPAPA